MRSYFSESPHTTEQSSSLFVIFKLINHARQRLKHSKILSYSSQKSFRHTISLIWWWFSLLRFIIFSWNISSHESHTLSSLLLCLLWRRISEEDKFPDSSDISYFILFFRKKKILSTVHKYIFFDQIFSSNLKYFHKFHLRQWD